jgi:hypothetical protein
MGTPAPVVLTKDVYTKVLTNVTNKGQVFILDQDIEPVAYLVAFVNTGNLPPAVDYAGGIKFDESFSPATETLSDYYVKPVNQNGLVVIFP